MAITYMGTNLVSFRDYIQQQVESKAANPPPSYAHPVDEWIRIAMEATPVRAIMDKLQDTMIAYEFGLKLAENPLVDSRTYPEIYDLLAHCADTLHIPIPQAIMSSGPMNAMAASTGESAIIIVFAPILDLCPPQEACFILGHECGHIAASHTLVLGVLNILTQLARLDERDSLLSQLLAAITSMGLPVALIPLMALSRRLEITADRAGLLCCGDLAAAEAALMRLQSGTMFIKKVDIEDALKRHRSMSEYYKAGRIKEIFRTHPITPKRIMALRLFANSELYYELAGKQPPAGVRLLTKEQLDRQVGQIAKP